MTDRPRHRVAEDEAKALLARLGIFYRAGIKASAIAGFAGVDHSHVRKISTGLLYPGPEALTKLHRAMDSIVVTLSATEREFEPHAAYWDETKTNILRKMWYQGEPLAKIAETFGTTPAAISGRIGRAGLKRRYKRRVRVSNGDS